MRAPTSIISVSAVALLAVATSAAVAEPSRIPKYLMNEPISMFDWGIYKADKKLESFKTFGNLFSIYYMGGSASYEWDSDRILIQVLFQGTGSEAECTENLKKAKGAFANFKWNENEQQKAAREALEALFSHEGGYTSASQPRDIGEQLVNITYLEAIVYTKSAKDTLVPKIKCRTNFKSKEISVSKD